MPEAVDVPGVARAGAAFATRRELLGISQRELASRKVISAPALIAFEKGRAWPRERTRALLEEVVTWPAGTLAMLRSGGEVPDGSSPAPPTVPQSAVDGEGAGALIVEALDVAMNGVTARIANLPHPSDPQFAVEARSALADLRQLESIAGKATRTRASNPAVIRALAGVRRAYDELMNAAAGAPGATLGQRLYTARRRANVSVAEVAAALGLTPELVLMVEAEGVVSTGDVPRIEALITDLLGL